MTAHPSGKVRSNDKVRSKDKVFKNKKKSREMDCRMSKGKNLSRAFLHSIEMLNVGINLGRVGFGRILVLTCKGSTWGKHLLR